MSSSLRCKTTAPGGSGIFSSSGKVDFTTRFMQKYVSSIQTEVELVKQSTQDVRDNLQSVRRRKRVVLGQRNKSWCIKHQGDTCFLCRLWAQGWWRSCTHNFSIVSASARCRRSKSACCNVYASGLCILHLRLFWLQPFSGTTVLESERSQLVYSSLLMTKDSIPGPICDAIICAVPVGHALHGYSSGDDTRFHRRSPMSCGYLGGWERVDFWGGSGTTTEYDDTV